MISAPFSKNENPANGRVNAIWLPFSDRNPQFVELESLYKTHMGNLNDYKSVNHRNIRKSFRQYIQFVYNLLDLGPIRHLEEDSVFQCVSSANTGPSIPPSLVSSNSQQPSQVIHPVDPRPVSGEDISSMVQQSTDMQIFRVVLLKIMCDEPITLDDLQKFNESKLFNLKKIVFVKFKRVINTELAN